jgi:hypothetical protein
MPLTIYGVGVGKEIIPFPGPSPAMNFVAGVVWVAGACIVGNSRNMITITASRAIPEITNLANCARDVLKAFQKSFRQS